MHCMELPCHHHLLHLGCYPSQYSMPEDAGGKQSTVFSEWNHKVRTYDELHENGRYLPHLVADRWVQVWRLKRFLSKNIRQKRSPLSGGRMLVPTGGERQFPWTYVFRGPRNVSKSLCICFPLRHPNQLLRQCWQRYSSLVVLPPLSTAWNCKEILFVCKFVTFLQPLFFAVFDASIFRLHLSLLLGSQEEGVLYTLFMWKMNQILILFSGRRRYTAHSFLDVRCWYPLAPKLLTNSSFLTPTYV